MTHEQLREAIARAIYEDRNGVNCKPWVKLPASHKAPYIGDAWAAIATIATQLVGFHELLEDQMPRTKSDIQ